MTLAARIEELSAEIRGYPTPIARCDEQLTALLEERANLLILLEKENQTPVAGCTPDAIWTNDGGSNAPSPV